MARLARMNDERPAIDREAVVAELGRMLRADQVLTDAASLDRLRARRRRVGASSTGRSPSCSPSTTRRRRRRSCGSPRQPDSASSRAAPAPVSRAARTRSARSIVVSLERMTRVLEVERRRARTSSPRRASSTTTCATAVADARPLVSARPGELQDLDDRRQRRDERRRHLLREVRRHPRLRARHDGRARRRRDRAPRPPHGEGRDRLRPHRAHGRLRGHARHHHRGDAQAAAARRPRGARRSSGSFASLEAAGVAVAAIAAAGIIPSALELIDEMCLRAVDEWQSLGLPHDAAALLLATVDEPGDAGAAARGIRRPSHDGCRSARRRAGGVARRGRAAVPRPPARLPRARAARARCSPRTSACRGAPCPRCSRASATPPPRTTS